MPLVSVIVPFYGVEKYIQRCAESLFAQTYKDIEFIFIDDGSPDRSVEVLEEVMGRYPERKAAVTIIRKANEGQSYARRDGIAASHGEFLMFVDSDDWIEPYAVEKLVEAAGEADIVCFGFWKEYGSHSKLDLEKDSSVEDPLLFVKRLYTYRAYGYLCTKLFRRNTLTGIFTPRYSMHEDIVVSTQALQKARKIVNLKEGLYHYDRTVSGASTRASKKTRRTLSARNMMDFYLAFEGKADAPTKLVENELLLRAAWTAFSLDKDLFREYPGLKEKARKLPLMPGQRIGLFRQLLLKLFL
ncbi:MAG: glycosyltransferase [Bacteroidales bacterium]|nr:glycosyltransferase [Bacteroidales bacterium]